MQSRKTLPLYLLALIVISCLSGACNKLEDGLSSIGWQINFDLVTTTWDIQFLDASTGMPIGSNSDDRIEVFITGDDQSNILDLAGIRQNTFFSTKGFLALALHPNRTTPQELTPVRFVIHASHAGYFPVCVPVMTHQDGINPVQVYMVSRTQAPDPVDLTTLTGVTQLVGGKVSDSVTVYTPLALASVDIPAGTEIFAPDGSRFEGSLNVTLAFWQGGLANGIRSLPGGQISMNLDGNPGLIYLAAGIYADLQADGGVLAGSLSGPLGCTAQIDRSVYNPFTKSKVTAGEAIPYWYRNPVSGIWESKGTVILEAVQNKLLARFSMDSPGLFMIGWINESLCPLPLTLKPTTLPEYQEISYGFTLNIYELYGDEIRFIRTAGISGQVSQDYPLRFLPDNSELLLRFENYIAGDKPYYKNPDPLLLSEFCGSALPVEFDLLPKPNSTYKKIEVVFIDVEHNNTRYNPKVFPGYYRKTGATDWQSAFVYNGHSYLVNPQEGDLYEMGINFKGEFHLKEVTVGSEEVVLVEIAIY